MAVQKRCGGKFGGDHTTFIDLAAALVDAAAKLPEVYNISPGFIQMGQGSGSGERRVKFVDMNGGALLRVRQSCSAQEVRVFTSNPQITKLALARAARDMGVNIGFQKPKQGGEEECHKSS
ncbi:MAG: DUF2103 domain-containing protein [Candidatus Wolfebacteria bacterium]|nr:DUF2103 domain-containing protein [Candidatus Wolfebacteria bacterium]